VDTSNDTVFMQPKVDGIDFLPDSAGLYCIMNRINGRRYVGQSKNIFKRCQQHRNELIRGTEANMLLRRDAKIHGVDAFFFFGIRIDGIADSARPSQLNKIEFWFSVQLGTHDERQGYNLEAGHHRTQASRFRERERKLLRRNSGKYQLLPGVDLYDPIHTELLTTWVPGS
jgi:group I intron endonuclease